MTVTQGNSFAANDGTGKIVAYTGYTKFTSSVPLSGITAASNVQVSSGSSPIVVTTGTGVVDINTMSFISNQTGSGSVYRRRKYAATWHVSR